MLTAVLAATLLSGLVSFAATRYVSFLTFVDRFVQDWETAALAPAEPP